MDLWATPLGAVALNIAASVLWDGGKYFASKARDTAGDRKQLDAISKAVSTRAGIDVGRETLKKWMEDHDFWFLVAEASRDSKSLSSAATALLTYSPAIDNQDDAAGVLAVLFVEVSQCDGELARRLQDTTRANKLDAIEVGLGYVLDEMLTAALAISTDVNSGFGRVEGQLEEVLNLLPQQTEDDVRGELRRIAQLLDEGVLLEEAAIQLQVIAYMERRDDS